jgi:hypothetical protein
MRRGAELVTGQRGLLPMFWTRSLLAGVKTKSTRLMLGSSSVMMRWNS